MKRDLISLKNLTRQEILGIIELTESLKNGELKECGQLNGQSVALLFQKPSNRTRVSFEVGIWQLGGNCIYLGPKEIRLGVRESAKDVAKTLSRYLDAIVARTYTHQDVVNLAENADIPIINGLSDMFHPCQALTDIFSIKEKFGRIDGIKIAYVGDGNNVCHSLMLACSKIGMDINIATPKGYEPKQEVVTLANESASLTGANITLTNNPEQAVEGVDVVYADVWVSMGQEAEEEKRLTDFEGFQINSKLIEFANKNYIFMHCLPAHRGQEVADDIIDGQHSIVFDQAENRLHMQKAILLFLLGRN